MCTRHHLRNGFEKCWKVLQSSYKFCLQAGILMDFKRLLLFGGQLGLEREIAETEGYVNRMSEEICKNPLSIYSPTEDGFFASLSTFQYCILYWLYSECTTLGKSYKIFWRFFFCDSWNLCCTYSRICDLENLGANPETGRHFIRKVTVSLCVNKYSIEKLF